MNKKSKIKSLYLAHVSIQEMVAAIEIVVIYFCYPKQILRMNYQKIVLMQPRETPSLPPSEGNLDDLVPFPHVSI